MSFQLEVTSARTDKSTRRRDPEVAEWVKALRQRYAGMKLLVGRDKLDEIQVCNLSAIGE